MHVVLGVCGGIAAYKACELLRIFGEAGHEVTVVPTEAALNFVGIPTWAALSGKSVSATVWDDVASVPHVRLGQTAELVVVAPTTADLLAKAANGLADDLLSTTLLTATCPVVMAPAMHTEMWEHPATQTNVKTLRSRGVYVLEPAVGRLTGQDSGKGRLPNPGQIFDYASQVSLSKGQRDLEGRSVVVSAGGTREAIDPVRYLTNRSSGKQGLALASAAAARGARVTLIAANVDLALPLGVEVQYVQTTAELAAAVTSAASSADAVVMAAAPADFRPKSESVSKIKKSLDGSPLILELTQNPDILAGLSSPRPHKGLVVVGFAAETGDATTAVGELGHKKLIRKGCDLLVLNDVSGGAIFGSDNNTALILGKDGSETPVSQTSKAQLAHLIWDEVAKIWKQ
jgi:phosphopantothenoylcysteine decarboxylase / phosphopantothenate---cysteine ligase